jgi:hypothetical protein
MPNALVLDASPSRGLRPGPAQPCLIFPAPWDRRSVLFADLAAFCRGLHRRRAGRAMRLEPTQASLCGSDSFPAFKVWFRAPDCDEAFAFTVAGVGDSREALQAALAANNPDAPQ